MNRGFDDVLGVSFTKGKNGRETVRYGKRSDPSEEGPGVKEALDWMDDCEQVITGRRPKEPVARRPPVRRDPSEEGPGVDSALQWMDGCERVIRSKRRKKQTERAGKGKTAKSSKRIPKKTKSSARIEKAKASKRIPKKKKKPQSSTRIQKPKDTGRISKKTKSSARIAKAKASKRIDPERSSRRIVKAPRAEPKKRAKKKQTVSLGWLDDVHSDERLIEPIHRPPTQKHSRHAVEEHVREGRSSKRIVEGPGHVVRKVVKKKKKKKKKKKTTRRQSAPPEPTVEFVGRTLPDRIDLSPSEIDLLAANPKDVFSDPYGRPLPEGANKKKKKKKKTKKKTAKVAKAPRPTRARSSRRESGRLRREKLKKSLIESSIEGDPILTQDELLRRALESSDIGPAIEDTRRLYAAPPTSFSPPPAPMASPFSDSDVWMPFAELEPPPPIPEPPSQRPSTKLERLKLQERSLTESSCG